MTINYSSLNFGSYARISGIFGQFLAQQLSPAIGVTLPCQLILAKMQPFFRKRISRRQLRRWAAVSLLQRAQFSK
jgi:hypothetical protein